VEGWLKGLCYDSTCSELCRRLVTYTHTHTHTHTQNQPFRTSAATGSTYYMEIRHGNQTITHNDCKPYAVLITNNNITDKWTTKFRDKRIKIIYNMEKEQSKDLHFGVFYHTPLLLHLLSNTVHRCSN